MTEEEYYAKVSAMPRVDVDRYVESAEAEARRRGRELSLAELGLHLRKWEGAERRKRIGILAGVGAAALAVGGLLAWGWRRLMSRAATTAAAPARRPAAPGVAKAVKERAQPADQQAVVDVTAPAAEAVADAVREAGGS